MIQRGKIVYPDVNAEEFAEMHGLEMTELKCNGCERYFIADIPFLYKDIPGFIIPDHKCDPKHYPFIFIMKGFFQ